MVNSKYISHENKEISSTCDKSEHILEFLNPHFKNIFKGFYPSKQNSKIVYIPNASKNWNTVPVAWHYACWSHGLCSALEMPRLVTDCCHPGSNPPKTRATWFFFFKCQCDLSDFKKFGRWHLAYEMITSITAEEEEVPYRGISSQ